MELSNIIHSLGWTIINSLWQGLFILILLAIALILINSKYAKIRSMLAYASLIIVFAASIRTFADINSVQTAKNKSSITSFSFSNNNLVMFHDIADSKNNKVDSSKTIWDGMLISISSFSSRNIKYIVAIWLAGILFLTFRMLGGYFYMQKIKFQKIISVEKQWLRLLKSIAEKLEISRSVQLFESAIVNFPTIIGYFKPVILMPLGSLAEMPMDQVEMILAHELAHVKRSDYMLNLIQSFLEVLYFFNPAMWIISKIIRNEREYACDDLALRINSDSTVLVNALISVHQKEIEKPVVALSALGTKNSLLSRIKRMVHNNNYKSNTPKKLALSSALIATLFTITIIACSSSMDNYNSSNHVNASMINFDKTPAKPEVQELFSGIDNIKPIEEIENAEKIVELERIKENNGKRKFNFHKDDTQWKGAIENGEVVKLYKDGKRIPENEINNHEDFILNTLDEIDDALADLEIDMDDLKVNMKQLKENLKDIKVDIDFSDFHEISKLFNSKDFHDGMAELKKSLKNMKIEFSDDLDFDTDEFKHEIKNLKHELEELHNLNFEFDFNFDKESFKESMNELKENLKDIKIDMGDLDIDLSDLKLEMTKLKNFMLDLKDDLVNESYIDSVAEDFDLDLSKNEITVNGKKLPDSLQKRYLKMYKEHFGKELENNFTIRN